MVFGCECIPHLSPMTHNEQGTHESLGVALIMVMSFVDLSSSKSPLAFVVTINDCAFKIVILLLVSLSSLLNTPRKMHKSKLNQNFYTIGRNNEAKNLSSNLDNRIGVGEKFTSGTLLNIIKQMSDGIHMALVSETVSDIPFSNIENYIIVFKGTSYGDPYTRIMAFPMPKSSAPKWGMVSWESSKIVWV